MTTMTFVPSTAPQIGFIKNLLSERVVSKDFEADLLLCIEFGELSKSDASDAIGVLLKSPKVPAEHLPAKVTETGYYFDKKSETVFEVVAAKTGNLYAKKMVPAASGKKGRWEYAPGAIKASGTWTKLTIAEAIVLGKTWGYCCVCGRTLTKTESIEAGIGPICAGKFS
jgi:hypothetical protein